MEIIENLKGRRSYEERRASKLGFASLYEYFEDKISKKEEADCKLRNSIKTKNSKNSLSQIVADKKPNCGCCQYYKFISIAKFLPLYLH